MSDLATPAALAPRGGKSHPINTYLNGLSKGSRPGQISAFACALGVMQHDARLSGLDPKQRQALREVGMWAFPWHELRHEHVAALRSRLQELYKYSTANKVLAAVRSLLKTCWQLGLIDHETMARATDVKAIKGSAPPAGRDIGYEEVVLLMRTCADHTPQGVRDAALFAVGYHCAPRIAEMANLKLKDFDQDSGALVIRSGKGGKTRQVYLSGGAADAMSDWLEVRGDASGSIFSQIRKDGLLRSEGLSSWSIGKRLDRRRLQAGIEHLTWHDWRRTLAGDLIDDGDLAGAQLTLGHSSPAITMKYSRRDLKIVETVLSKRNTPYFRSNGQKKDPENTKRKDQNVGETYS